MENLLKWSIDAAQNGKTDEQPDPKLLAQLLGAPDDVTLMREELRAAVESQNKAERLDCLEAFEEHVENVDNANNIGKLWEPLLYLTKDEDDDIRALALSCIGAAVQNNDKAQGDLVATKAGISMLVERTHEKNESVLAKALLALSSALGHCESAYDQFVEADGWNRFATLFTINFEQTADTSSQKIRTRVLSLLFSIVLMAPNKSVLDNIDNLDLVKRLKKIESQQNDSIKEKIHSILTTLADNPRQETRLLTQ